MYKIILILLTSFLFIIAEINACSVIYFVDSKTGNIYIANNEDYWYDVNAYIVIRPPSKSKLGRLWYGWDDFAQGGINEAGLFFDGAVTPEQSIPEGYGSPKGNLGDEILANCKTVEQALDFLEEKQVALKNAHMMFGDSSGNAVIVEWIVGKKEVISISDNSLVMTNFLIGDTTKGNYPCYRYQAIKENIKTLEDAGKEVTLKQVGNLLGPAVQVPRANAEGKIGGTLYSSFMDISKMEFVLVFKLDNTKITRLDLNEEFANKKKRKIKLE